MYLPFLFILFCLSSHLQFAFAFDFSIPTKSYADAAPTTFLPTAETRQHHAQSLFANLGATDFCDLWITGTVISSLRQGVDGFYQFFTMYNDRPAYKSSNLKFFLYYEPNQTNWKISDALGDNAPGYTISWAMVADLAESPENINHTWYINGKPESSTGNKTKVQCQVAKCKLPTTATALNGYNLTTCPGTGRLITQDSCALSCRTEFTGTPEATCPFPGFFVLDGTCTRNQCTLPPTISTGYLLTRCDTTNGPLPTIHCVLTCDIAKGYKGSPSVQCLENGGLFTITGSCAIPSCLLPATVSRWTGYDLTRCDASTSPLTTKACSLGCNNTRFSFGSPKATCAVAGTFKVTSPCTHMCNVIITSPTIAAIGKGVDGLYTFYQMYGNAPAFISENGLFYLYFERNETNWKISDGLGASSPSFTLNWAMVSDVAPSPDKITGRWYVNGLPASDVSLECQIQKCVLPPEITTENGYVLTQCDTSAGPLADGTCVLSCAEEYVGTPLAACPVSGQFELNGQCKLPKCTLPRSVLAGGYDLTLCDVTSGPITARECTLSCDATMDYAGSPVASCTQDGGEFEIAGPCAIPLCTLPSTVIPRFGYVLTDCDTSHGPIAGTACSLSCDPAKFTFGTPSVTCPSSGVFELLSECTRYYNLVVQSPSLAAINPSLEGLYGYQSMYENHPAYKSLGGEFYLYYEPSQTSWKLSNAIGDGVMTTNYALVSDTAATPDLITTMWYVNNVPTTDVNITNEVQKCTLPAEISPATGYIVDQCDTSAGAVVVGACNISCDESRFFYGAPFADCLASGPFDILGTLCARPTCDTFDPSLCPEGQVRVPHAKDVRCPFAQCRKEFCCVSAAGKCGNHIVDTDYGEECEPPNAQCCDSQCHYKRKGTVCRKRLGQCDQEERCDGLSGRCPYNKNAKDGLPCRMPGAFYEFSQRECRGGVCKLRVWCGNGKVEEGEECDPPGHCCDEHCRKIPLPECKAHPKPPPKKPHQSPSSSDSSSSSSSKSSSSSSS